MSKDNNLLCIKNAKQNIIGPVRIFLEQLESGEIDCNRVCIVAHTDDGYDVRGIGDIDDVKCLVNSISDLTHASFKLNRILEIYYEGDVIK